METNPVLSEEQLDYLTEIMNIGAGNAAGALEQFVGCSVEMGMSEIHFFTVAELRRVFNDASRPFIAVNMALLGEMTGDIIFMMAYRHLTTLLEIMKSGGGICPMLYHPGDADVSVLEELGNVLTGVFLTAVQKMIGLNIYHTVPGHRIGRADDILYDFIYRKYPQQKRVTVIETRFIIEHKSRISFYSLLAPSPRSIHAVADTLKNHELRI